MFYRPACSEPKKTRGIKGSKDSGTGRAKAGGGKAPTAMSGIKGGKDTVRRGSPKDKVGNADRQQPDGSAIHSR